MKLLVLDGIDNDFIEYGKEIACPKCEGVIVYFIVNSYEFDTLPVDPCRGKMLFG